MEPRGRQQPMIQLVKASQQQQYAYAYLDDRGSFVRAQKAEEERIQQDMERALRAQRRNKARQVVRASKAVEQVANAASVDGWYHGGNARYPNVAPKPRQVIPKPQQVQNSEKSRLQHFKFPQLEPTRPQFIGAVRNAPPFPLPTERLAPLSRFNPFAMRARSESLSSIENDRATDAGKRKRNASVSALFARIHREAENMRRQGY
ncbi:hypothetical protein DFH07DRAFT_961065 [Mycena maculata]|uniref:Uncharacterized protein n=1 Tax=Mycena maculata TaxID=230809 RepID=A0AAD7IVC8_9AGAR|nr:hypothetical protein DFH07DRAFT_961065 [Mycena maculata]